jgi:hypothetical protein
VSVKVTEDDVESMFNNPVVNWITMEENIDGSWTVSFKNEKYLKKAMEYVKSDEEGGWFECFEFKEEVNKAALAQFGFRVSGENITGGCNSEPDC